MPEPAVCPHCGAKYDISKLKDTREISCKRCNATITLRPELAKTEIAVPPPAASVAASVPQASSIDLHPGQVIGKCRIEKVLGRGGMGAVYLATHTMLEIPVAVKVLPPHIAADNPRFVERFLREARLAARVDHPNVMGVKDVGQDEQTGLHYIILEYVAGGSVADLLKKGPLEIDRALDITMGVARALVKAEELNIIHRDIKPDNIMLTESGQVKLADLGLAKDIEDEESSATMSGVVMGTPAYMSPEQAMDSKNVDAQGDIYSLGATLYHMLVGEPPFTGKTAYNILHNMATQPVPDPHLKRPELPPTVIAICFKAMAKKKEKRYKTAADLLEDLRKVREQGVTDPAKLLAAGMVAPAVRAKKEHDAADHGADAVHEPLPDLSKPKSKPKPKRKGQKANKPAPAAKPKNTPFWQSGWAYAIGGGAAAMLLLLLIANLGKNEPAGQQPAQPPETTQEPDIPEPVGQEPDTPEPTEPPDQPISRPSPVTPEPKPEPVKPAPEPLPEPAFAVPAPRNSPAILYFPKPGDIIRPMLENAHQAALADHVFSEKLKEFGKNVATAIGIDITRVESFVKAGIDLNRPAGIALLTIRQDAEPNSLLVSLAVSDRDLAVRSIERIAWKNGLEVKRSGENPVFIDYGIGAAAVTNRRMYQVVGSEQKPWIEKLKELLHQKPEFMLEHQSEFERTMNSLPKGAACVAYLNMNALLDQIRRDNIPDPLHDITGVGISVDGADIVAALLLERDAPTRNLLRQGGECRKILTFTERPPMVFTTSLDNPVGLFDNLIARTTGLTKLAKVHQAFFNLTGMRWVMLRQILRKGAAAFLLYPSPAADKEPVFMLLARNNNPRRIGEIIFRLHQFDQKTDLIRNGRNLLLINRRPGKEPFALAVVNGWLVVGNAISRIQRMSKSTFPKWQPACGGRSLFEGEAFMEQLIKLSRNDLPLIMRKFLLQWRNPRLRVRLVE